MTNNFKQPVFKSTEDEYIVLFTLVKKTSYVAGQLPQYFWEVKKAKM